MAHDDADDTETTGTGPGVSRDGESRWQRLDRELIELVNEIRISLPGTMVLFSFLLLLPFNDKFDQLEGFEKAVYFATFLTTAVAAVLLIAPSIHHRLRWRRGDRERIVMVANRLVITGSTLLAVSIGGAVFLITDLTLGMTPAIILGASGLVLVTLLWFGLPASWARHEDQDVRDPNHPHHA